MVVAGLKHTTVLKKTVVRNKQSIKAPCFAHHKQIIHSCDCHMTLSALISSINFYFLGTLTVIFKMFFVIILYNIGLIHNSKQHTPLIINKTNNYFL